MPEREYAPVRELDPSVARKIAAGEVIDRPAAVVRELLDNALDAGASKISVELAGGGIDLIRVVDDGCGMTAEDLGLCSRAHTTSKIAREDDLLTLSTLGFRGEALSSIQAVSRLEITSTRNGREAWKLADGRVEPSRLHNGTIVSIANLFENFPARRQFLKRPATETALCRQIFIEKALPWPAVDFRLTVDGKIRDILNPAASLRERWIDAMGPKEPDSFFHELIGSGNGFTFTAVIGSPEVIRSDRRDLMIFVNGRRIQEYSLIQAMEYGAEGHFPNGTHPAGALFVTLDPSLVDFNIHPAKKEARFRDSGALHHGVSQRVRDFFRRYTIALVERSGTVTEREGYRGLFAEAPGTGAPPPRERSFTDLSSFTARDFKVPPRYPDDAAEGSPVSSWSRSGVPGPAPETLDHPLPFRYLGQVLGTFLLAEKDDALYLIDQHAAHERILFDELMENGDKTQELLVPYRLETDSPEDDDNLEARKAELREAGFTLEKTGKGAWEITSVPVRWNGTEGDLRDALLETNLPAEALVSKLYAGAACKGACKDGDLLDPLTARNLVARALSLREPRCPHGRPVWTVVDREELFRRVKRT